MGLTVQAVDVDQQRRVDYGALSDSVESGRFATLLPIGTSGGPSVRSAVLNSRGQRSEQAAKAHVRPRGKRIGLSDKGAAFEEVGSLHRGGVVQSVMLAFAADGVSTAFLGVHFIESDESDKPDPRQTCDVPTPVSRGQGNADQGAKCSGTCSLRRRGRRQPSNMASPVRPLNAASRP